MASIHSVLGICVGRAMTRFTSTSSIRARTIITCIYYMATSHRRFFVLDQSFDWPEPRTPMNVRGAWPRGWKTFKLGDAESHDDFRNRIIDDEAIAQVRCVYAMRYP